MEYIFSISEPHNRFVSIQFKVEGPFSTEGILLQLPSWRPGRYELGNFAKNVKAFAVADENGTAMSFIKESKDCWRVHGKARSITVSYQYYAAQPDAGACYLDHDQLYINPIHCCFYIPGRTQERCRVTLQVPENWKVATGMKMISSHQVEAANFDQLVDCPFIASPSIAHAHYTLAGITFNIWIQGETNPDWFTIIKDFEAFTEVQLKTMKEFPAKDYHFLVLLLPFPFYHGVEHLNSTVLALGPGYKLMQAGLYKELVGVASHELFHCWNVKSIRPAEMLPYNYEKENYADTGYVYEGITTYYGDLFLARSGFFNLKGLLDEYAVRFQKHMDNPGRFNYSVAQSSFDTWLDGYVAGVPGRKTSIYDEGCLLAWILDFMIRSSTASNHSLDDVMRYLYFEFAKKGKGYTGNDFREVAEKMAGRNFKEFFTEYVYKASSLETLLSEVISLAGIHIVSAPHINRHESAWGMKTESRNGNQFVATVYPGSPAYAAGLMKDDELIAINGIRIENNTSDLIRTNEVLQEVTYASGRKIRQVMLKTSENTYYNRYSIVADESCTRAQLAFRQQWLSV